MYMIVSLCVLPVTQAAVAIFTHVKGATYSSRVLVIPSLVTVLLMGASVTIGGADMYRLWIARGADWMAGEFFSGSWRYNLIVLVHYYTYWIVLIGEAVYMAIYVAVRLSRFNRMLKEYYTDQQHNSHYIRGIYLTVGINCLCVIVNYVFFPFNTPRPEGVVGVICLLQSIDLFLLGWYFYHLNYSAENLGDRFRNANKYGRSNLTELGDQIIQYVEREKGYLNPDLSVFMLSEIFKVSQDDVVDAIHRLHGTPFGEYVDSLRIEHAIAFLEEHPAFNVDDNEHLSMLAHTSGYTDTDALQQSFSKVLQTTVEEWKQRQ
jgi:AraC-like DNA-binding protein